jgi:O-antigen biosynthesis protein
MGEATKTEAAVEQGRREQGRREPEDDAPPPELSRYHRDIDLASESTHTRVIRLIGTGVRVLELGPSSGHMSRVLRDQGCSVVAIELDPESAAVAAQYCERVIVADLDSVNLDEELGSDRFDVIVAADVLEHLKNPLDALRRLRGFLAPGGSFVISLPNVAHGSVRLALLEGRFRYQELGLLDATHLRFFTRESIGQLLDDAELVMTEMYLQQLEIDASEVAFDRRRVPTEVMQALERDPDATTYQFVIKALPSDMPGLREMQRRMRELATENARLHEAALRRDAELDELREVARSLRQAHESAQAQISMQHEQLRRLRIRLDRILTSPPAKAYAKLRQLPGLRRLAARRTAGYEAALREAAGGDGNDR